MERSVFYISDGTAITAEVLGHAVLSQFPVKATTFTLPFVESAARAQEVCQKINQIYQETGVRPLVFYSIISAEVRELIQHSEGFCQDIVQALVAPLQSELGVDPNRCSTELTVSLPAIWVNTMRESRLSTMPWPMMTVFRYVIWTKHR